MRTFRLIAASAIFAAIFAVSAFAQTAAGKIGLINTQAFADEKEGIAKYVAGLKSLDKEFQPVFTELQTLATKIQALQKELEALQKQSPTVPVKPETLSAKAEEYDKLTREYKFKQEDAKARYERRELAVMSPVRQDIGKALQEFTKKNGFVMTFDVAKLDSAGVLLGMDETADVTKAFIVFYNARPATTAAVTK